MPTYEYECTACGGTFEVFQSITEGALRKCRKCGKLRARRLIGAGSAVIFKGSGFYQTDYRSPEYQKQAKADSSTGSDSGESSKTPAKDTKKKPAKSDKD